MRRTNSCHTKKCTRTQDAVKIGTTGQEDASSSWRNVKLVFLRKGKRSCRAIALTSEMSQWCVACVVHRLEKEKALEVWKQLHVGGIDGIRCQDLPLMMTQLQTHWEWEEDRRKHMWHGSEERPTICFGQHGHPDGLRRGDTKAYCEHYW